LVTYNNDEINTPANRSYQGGRRTFKKTA
ncbi:MAG: hypothetical protein ACI8ZO_001600, partial [Flavobacteriales bacterium]